MNDAVAIGVAVLGHGSTATQLLEAARGIVGTDALDGVIAIDAGVGETPVLTSAICQAIATADRGRGVVVLVDLLGASPCQCVQRESSGHLMTMVAGLNLGMLLKLAGLDRTRLEPHAVAEACAEAGKRSIVVSDVDRSSGVRTP